MTAEEAERLSSLSIDMVDNDWSRPKAEKLSKHGLEKWGARARLARKKYLSTTQQQLLKLLDIIAKAESIRQFKSGCACMRQLDKHREELLAWARSMEKDTKKRNENENSVEETPITKTSEGKAVLTTKWLKAVDATKWQTKERDGRGEDVSQTTHRTLKVLNIMAKAEKSRDYYHHYYGRKCDCIMCALDEQGEELLA